MVDLSHALQQGTIHAWLFIPSAVLLGALHGLEPGHSKTMMAAFIIAIRGTIPQAVLLGLAAAFSHSLIIWTLAAVALRYGSRWSAESTEPYFQLASAVIIAGIALWMLWRTKRDVNAAAAHDHSHGHDHVHDDTKILHTGRGLIRLSVFEEGVPPVFRLEFMENGRAFLPEAGTVSLETMRPGGARQVFAFAPRDHWLESTTTIPEPHEFDLTLTVAHQGQTHAYAEHFREATHHHHADLPAGAEYQDAHEAAHALDIQKRFTGGRVTTPQIVLFGVTGGLLPCPAAFTILLVCLQVKQFTLGFALVAAFSFGLALTLVTIGTAAAWSVQHARQRFAGFSALMRKAPYFSCALLLLMAAYMAWHGWAGFPPR